MGAGAPPRSPLAPPVSKTNELSRIGNAQSMSQDPFKMGKRKLKLMNG